LRKTREDEEQRLAELNDTADVKYQKVNEHILNIKKTLDQDVDSLTRGELVQYLETEFKELREDIIALLNDQQVRTNVSPEVKMAVKSNFEKILSSQYRPIITEESVRKQYTLPSNWPNDRTEGDSALLPDIWVNISTVALLAFLLL